MGQADDILAARTKHLYPCAPLLHPDAPVFVVGEGCYLIDRAGRRFLDCTSGDGVVNAGYRNPMILNAVVDQLWQLSYCPTEHLTEPLHHLAQALAEMAPAGLGRSFFCTCPLEAKTAALLAATQFTGRLDFIALSSASAIAADWIPAAPPLRGWIRFTAEGGCAPSHVPHGEPAGAWRVHALPPRTSTGEDSDAARGVARRLPRPADLRQLLEQLGPHRIAAVLAEPLPYDDGLIIPTDDYWPEIRRVCTEGGVLLVFDETRTGMNRTGRWLACEHWQVAPDLLILGDSLANGQPIAVLLTSDDVAASCRDLGAVPFGASPVSCAAALATMRFHRTASLTGRAERQGAALLAGMTEAAGASHHLAHPRGKGLTAAVDVVNDAGEPDAARCERYLEQFRNWGFLVGRAGFCGNVLTFLPPLTITEDQVPLITRALSELDRADAGDPAPPTSPLE
jgi:alanine-glyoxylate transaminase/(R)-3-amino-2-methylpropionate-pyruvate transaminase